MLGSTPYDGQQGQDKMIQFEFDKRVGCRRVEVGVFAEKEVGDGGDQNEE
jgi:hypothetical protein